jgi:hypothetical protein
MRKRRWYDWLKRVKELPEQQAGSLEMLAAEVERAESIAGEVGSLECLKKCIAFWKDLEGGR